LAEVQGNSNVLDILRGPDRGVQLYDGAHYKTLKVGELVSHLAKRGIAKKSMTRDQIVDALVAWDLVEAKHRQHAASCYRVRSSTVARREECLRNRITDTGVPDDEICYSGWTEEKDDGKYDESGDDGNDGDDDDEEEGDDGDDDDEEEGEDDANKYHRGRDRKGNDVEHKSHERRSGKRSVRQPSRFVDHLAGCEDGEDDDDDEGDDDAFEFHSGWDRDGKRVKEVPKGSVVDDNDKPVYADENGKTVATLFEVYSKEVARLNKSSSECCQLLDAPSCQSSDKLNPIWTAMIEDLDEMLGNEESFEDRDIVATALNVISTFIRGKNTFLEVPFNSRPKTCVNNS